jgi:hypothetical protein
MGWLSYVDNDRKVDCMRYSCTVSSEIFFYFLEVVSTSKTNSAFYCFLVGCYNSSPYAPCVWYVYHYCKAQLQDRIIINYVELCPLIWYVCRNQEPCRVHTSCGERDWFAMLVHDV